MPTMFGVEGYQPAGDEEEEGTPRIYPALSMGVKVMSIGFFINPKDALIWRGPMATNALRQLTHQTDWGELDFLLIDMPPGTGDVALTILQQLPVQGVIMVSTPQPMVSMIVSKAVHMCEQMHVPVLGILENMAYLDCPHCGERIDFYNTDQLSEFLESSGLKLYGTLPMMDLIRDVSGYEGYDLRSREQVDGFMKDVAAQVMADVTASAQQQA